MFNRRTFLSLVAGSIAAPGLSSAQPASQKVALYANVGADLTHYDVDVAGAELIKRATVTLPAGVQYAWPHASRRYLYVATSSSAPGYGAAGTEHHVTAFRIDPASGALTPHGAPIRLPTRPIHMTTDIPSENILVAFNNPSAVRVYRINKDFTPGEEVTAAGPDRRRHLRPSGARDPRQPIGDPGHPRQRRHPDQGRRPGRAESLRLQGRRADQRSVRRAQRRERVRPAAPRFPSDQAVDVRVDRDAEQDVHVSDGRRQDQTRRSPTARRRWPSRTTSGRVRRRARSTSIRTAGFCTGRIAPRQRSSFRARRCSKAARTASWCTRSINPPASRRRSSTSRRARYTRAPFTSTRADACWSRNTICR